MATLYRCSTPTNWLCPCGKVARALAREGIGFDEVRVPQRRSRRGESASADNGDLSAAEPALSAQTPEQAGAWMAAYFSGSTGESEVAPGGTYPLDGNTDRPGNKQP